MHGNEFITSEIQFDHDAHCLLLSGLPVTGTPIDAQDKMKRFARLIDVPMQDDNALIPLIKLVFQPVIVPKVELDASISKPSDHPIIVMGPTAGHTPTTYNLLDTNDHAIAISNQILAVGWEMTRQALTQMGAEVMVSQDIYSEVGIVMRAPDGAMQPVQQIFTRDSGVMIGDDYFIASEEAIYDISMKAMRSAAGPAAQLSSRAQKLAQLMAGLKPRFGYNVARAFNIAGKSLETRTIDAFFEGGDIFVDPRKGIILVGDDQRTNDRTRGLVEHNQRLSTAFTEITGKRPITIERPYSLDGKGRDDGERYHLDCFMALLPKGELLVDPRYTTPKSLEVLKGLYGENLIVIGPENPTTTTGPVGTGQVPNYTANLVAVGNQLLMPTCSSALKATLEGRGYTVVTAQNFNAPPGLFYMRGGGIHCVTQDFPSYKIQ